MRRLRMCCFFFGPFAVMLSGARSQSEPVTLDDVLKHWIILEEAGSHLEVSFTLRHPSSTKGIQPLPQSGKFVVDGKSVSVRFTAYTSKLPQSEGVIAKNERYAFTLSRDNQDVPFVMSFLGKSDNDLHRRLFVKMNEYHGCTVPWNAAWKPLSVWLNEPGFSVLGLRQEPGQGKKSMVCMDCSYRPPDSNTNYRFSRLMVRLDPHNHFRVDSYDAVFEKGSFSGKVDYGTNDGDLPIPIRKTITFNYRDKPRPAVWVCDYHEWKYRKKSPSDNAVSLSAFDLPEPKWGKPPERPRTWIWLMAATFGLAGLAVFFARLKRRAASKAKAKSPFPLKGVS